MYTYVLSQGLLPIWTNLLYVDCIRVYVVNKLLEVDKSKQSSWPTYIFAQNYDIGPVWQSDVWTSLQFLNVRRQCRPKVRMSISWNLLPTQPLVCYRINHGVIYFV